MLIPGCVGFYTQRFECCRNMLAKGNPEFCAILVAVNSILQIVLYAPFALFYLQVGGPALHRRIIAFALNRGDWLGFCTVIQL